MGWGEEGGGWGEEKGGVGEEKGGVGGEEGRGGGRRRNVSCYATDHNGVKRCYH